MCIGEPRPISISHERWALLNTTEQRKWLDLDPETRAEREAAMEEVDSYADKMLCMTGKHGTQFYFILLFFSMKVINLKYYFVKL